MTDNRNTGIDNGPDFFGLAKTSFQLYGLRSGFDKFPGVGNSCLRIRISVNGQVSENEGAFGARATASVWWVM